MQRLPALGRKLARLGGGIGLVTQGGGLGRAFIQASERGVGVGLWCSTGNEADLTMADVVHHMVGDPDIRVIALLAEGFRDGPRFLAAARAAARAGKPVVASRGGELRGGRVVEDGREGCLVSLSDTIEGCERILADEFSEYPEKGLYMIGAIEEAVK